ncbi:MAG: hypothetical protein Q8P01_05740 [bacterium]|nr:hypothetical protein [bacterium]
MVLLYLIHRVAYRVLEFFRHWYVNGFRLYWSFIVRSLMWFDRYFAWKITLRHIFEPLYKDYSVLGYMLGVPFRFGKVVAGGVVYALFLFVAAAVFLIWLLAVPYIIVRIVLG